MSEIIPSERELIPPTDNFPICDWHNNVLTTIDVNEIAYLRSLINLKVDEEGWSGYDESILEIFDKLEESV